VGTLAYFAADQRSRELGLDLPLQEAFQRTRTEDGVVTEWR
jgi:hypothetical protein